MHVIPALDIRDGRCVRLLYGKYDAETRYEIDPVDQATRYADLGLEHLHLVDLDGAKAGEPVNTALLKRMADASGVAVQLGGGIRTAEHIETLLANGVSRVVIGSMAIKAPATVVQWLTQFGSERIVLALDVNVLNSGVAHVATDAWTNSSEQTLNAAIDHFLPFGLKHVLCTDIGRDGAMQGPATALYQQVLQRYPDLQLQASGGVSSIGDLCALRDAGLPAAITGKALLENKITEQELRAF